MDQRIIDLYDRFTHGVIDRREFLDRLTKIAGSTAAALALLPLLQNDYARRRSLHRTTGGSPSIRYIRCGRHVGQRLPGAAEIKGKAPGGDRNPREPRA